MNNSSSLLLVGIGTSGSAIARGVSRAFGEGLRYVLADTDATTGNAGGPFILLGGNRLSGRGTGGDVVAGRLAAEDSIRSLDDSLEGVRLAVIATTLGGGTGGGATLEALKHLSERGIPSVVFATTPFVFEGEDRQRNARGIIPMIEDAANATFLLPLDKLIGETDVMENAMRHAVDVIAGGITLFWRLVEKPGYIRLDAERLRHLLSGAGRGRFATATVQGPNRATEAVDRLLRSDMLTTSSGPVKSVLCGILAGNDLLLSEVGMLADGIRNSFGGLSFDLATVNDENTFSGRISVVVMLFEANGKSDAAATPASSMSPGRNRRGKPRGVLGVGPTGRGRFQKAEPTIWNGEDLDVPTFVRRDINLDI